MKKLFRAWAIIAAILGVRSEEIIRDDIPELRYMNKNVNPCDDFYEYTCGNFKTVHPLSGNALTIDQFTLLEDKLYDITNSILSARDLREDPQALKKARAAFKACKDEDYLRLMKHPELTIVHEENGFPLVEPTFRRKSTKFGFYEIADAVSKYGVPLIFTIEAYSDLVDPTKNLIRLYQDRIENPSMIRPYTQASYEEILENEFLTMGSTNHKGRSALAPFDIFLRRIAFKLKKALQSFVSEEKIIENIGVMANFMKGIYRGGYIPDGVNVTSFPLGVSITLEQLNQWTKDNFGDRIQLDWVEYMQRVFANAGVEITKDTKVLTPTATNRLIYGVLNWVSMADQETVKDFALMRIFLYMAPDSDEETRKAFEEYYRGLHIAIPSREEYCTRKIVDAVGTAGLSFAVAYEFQLRHFNVNQLSKALQMIRDLQSSFQEIIQELTWMDAESKAVAIKKVENLVTILGYPDFVHNRTLLDKFYENVRICKWDNYGNSRRIRAFKQAYQISQLAHRDRAFWDKSPFEVNAYYNRPNNKIIFPVAMLNPVFFGASTIALDYGRIGSIIGHEITHGFDAQGQLYDQDGAFQKWWSAATQANFNNRSTCFIEQYNKYHIPEIDAYVNGSLTLNENIADNGGARESYRAIKRLLNRTTVIPYASSTYSAEQLFFIGFSTMWCNNPSVEYLNMMQTGVHAMSKWRVNGVLSNMEEFSEAFSCPSGSNMNPVNKCRLW